MSEVFCDFKQTEPTLPKESFTEPDMDFPGCFDYKDECFDIETPQSSSGSLTNIPWQQARTCCCTYVYT